MLIIPAIDLIDGKIVRLKQGEYDSKTVYYENPIDFIEQLKDYKFPRIHLVNLSNADMENISNYSFLNAFKYNNEIKIQYGGGIRKAFELELLSNAGVDYFIIGSLFFSDNNEFKKMVSLYNSEQFIISADIMDKNVYIRGWKENSNINIDDAIKMGVELKTNTFLITDIKRDGMLQSPNFDLYKELQEKYPGINIIASGGVSSLDDLKILEDIGVYGVVVGKAIFENKISLKELKNFDN
ncbi:MAG: 1-(5-phosphoribosyl)-5-[(5-phosphoribosylamino)methylideneamino] imidazole-4-carboxamide isomerase [Ignavibacteriaceae bacterium]|jgi:phosphoribosylformimino-5-aminoimidazole carboxamide ribotide isomerase|nr:1-(5-phosphoribosyl)-5-[(5-phosphoribosylamino)methylideneamino] imidazole-4-carboxamide isomerase [Ignavibacteriaceae bacterium]